MQGHLNCFSTLCTLYQFDK